MTFEEITNRVPEVRVIASTRSPTETSKAMIGGEFKVNDNPVAVWNKDKSRYFWFNKSDVQFLTPLSFKGKRIEIGDEVKYTGEWRKVYGFSWHDGKYGLDTVTNNDFEEECEWFSEEDIEDHRTHQAPTSEEIEKAKAVLEEAGVIVEGKIIK